MKKLPTSLNISGQTVKVVTRKHLSKKVKNMIGRATYTENLIELSHQCEDNKVEPQYMACTLVHEIIHHLDDKLTIGLKEVQVDRLAIGIYQVLKDNKLKFF